MIFQQRDRSSWEAPDQYVIHRNEPEAPNCSRSPINHKSRNRLKWTSISFNKQLFGSVTLHIKSENKNLEYSKLIQ